MFSQNTYDRQSLNELRAWLIEHAESVAISCWGEPQIRRRREWRWGSRNGSLALALVGDRRGLWIDRATNEGGDLVAMLRKAHGSFQAAVEAGMALGFRPASAGMSPEQFRRAAAIFEADQAERAKKAGETREAEDAGRIGSAQALWAERVEQLEGTPGFIYLTTTRGIPEPVGGFSEDIAWHPGERALIAAARSPSGEVTAVQVVRLNASGRKRNSASHVKQTYGRLTGAHQSFLRLPALTDAPDTPLMHAEGIETGLSAWVATRYETWVALGSRRSLQPNRVNIVLADDDPPDSDRAKTLKRDSARWSESGIRVILATPWTEPRGDKSDFNDVIKEGGVEAVLARIREAQLQALGLTSAEPPRALPTATLDEARAYLERSAREFLQPTLTGQLPPQMVLTSEGGTGKTDVIGRLLPEVIVAAKKEGRPHRYIVLIPEHKLGAQVTERLAAFGSNAVHLRGRGDPFNPKPNDPCQNPESVREAIRAGQSVAESCCGRGCPVFDRGACAYTKSVAQARDADLVVATHDHLVLPLSKKLREGVDGLIIDEDPLSKLDWQFTVTAEYFSAGARKKWPVLTGGETDQDATRRLGWIHEKIRALVDACVGGLGVAQAIKTARLTRDEIADGRKLERRRERSAPMKPGMPLEERKKVAEAAAINGKLGKIVAFYNALEAVLAGEDGRLKIRLDMEGNGPVYEIKVQMQKHLAPWTEGLPVLIANATANMGEVRRHFPRAVERKGPTVATPHARLILISGGFSKSSMARSARKRASVATFLKAAFPGRDIGIVGHKSSVGDFAHIGRTTWHGANAGDDSFRNVEVGVVFDGPRASSSALAELVAARTGRLVSEAKPVLSYAPVLMADGSAVNVPAWGYSDPDLQAAHESITQSGVDQAGARWRQITRTASSPVTYVQFGNVAPNRPVDAIYRWEAPDRLTEMVVEGRVLLNARSMHLWHPKKFCSVKASSRSRERFGDIMGRLRDLLARDPRSWLEIRFQVAGRGHHVQTAFVLAKELDAFRAEAEAKLGQLVYWDVQPFTEGGNHIPISGIDLSLFSGMTSRPSFGVACETTLVNGVANHLLLCKSHISNVSDPPSIERPG